MDHCICLQQLFAADLSSPSINYPNQYPLQPTLKKFVDLHTHSTASDGTSTPADVVRFAKEANLAAISLTDHDTVGGIEQAQRKATELGIDFLAGIEISCEYPRPGTMHILGYGIDPKSTILTTKLDELIAARNARNEAIIAALQKEGIAITMDMVRSIASGVVGRPHIAKVLQQLGVVSNSAQAFRKYLGDGGSAWSSKERLDARQAISLIHEAGGVASLAHPVQLKKTNYAQLKAEIKNLKDVGLDAIETLHSDHRESFVAELTDIANTYKLLRTGGSDFHGAAKPHIKIGRAQNRRHIPFEFYLALCERIANGAK